MSNQKEIYWTGHSGRLYWHQIATIGIVLPDEQGNLVITKLLPDGSWQVLQLRETPSLRAGLAECLKIGCVSIQATHVHFHTTAHFSDRVEETRDLLNAHPPTCKEAIIKLM